MRSIQGVGFTSTAIALAATLVILSTPRQLPAQETESDRFEITLSQPVTIGHKVLQPGNYSVEPLTIAGNDAPVLMISGPRGIKLQAAAVITAALENRIQPETRVTLHHIGARYYFDRIWVKGLAYGYRFPLPKGVKDTAAGTQ